MPTTTPPTLPYGRVVFALKTNSVTTSLFEVGMTQWAVFPPDDDEPMGYVARITVTGVNTLDGLITVREDDGTEHTMTALDLAVAIEES